MLRLLAATCVVLTLAAAPASAATVEELKPCYVSSGETDAERETITIRGSDFTQISTVEVLFDGVPVGSGPTGSIGEFEIRLPAPFQERGERALVVTVRDAATQVVKTTRVTNLGMTVKPRRAAPRRKVRFRGRGFTLAGPVYAHYLFGGKVQKTVRLARASANPCGTFDVRRRLIPIDGARVGRWVMQVDQKRGFSRAPDPVWVRREINVAEVFP
jgi:hypothetical protein